MQQDFWTKFFHDLTNMMSPEGQILQLKWHQFHFRLGLHPRPSYKTHDAPKVPLKLMTHKREKSADEFCRPVFYISRFHDTHPQLFWQRSKFVTTMIMTVAMVPAVNQSGNSFPECQLSHR